jgi:hypothetical protein
MHTVVLEVCAGLGNRLRAMVSGFCAAEEIGRSLRIVWGLEPSCGASFEQLFENEFPGVIFYKSMPAGTKKTMCLSPADWLAVKDMDAPIVIKSYGQFTENRERFLYWLRQLRPRREIVEATDPIFLLGPVVGIHMRRGDHVKCIANSPTSLFIDAMRRYPKDTVFFVASDSDEDRERLEWQFPGQVRTVAQNLVRDTAAGMVDAMKDFVALSRCSEILGTKGSSFSEMAAAYGDKPLHQLFIKG